MKTTNYLSSEQVSHIFTAYSPATIRELAVNGKVPVANWSDREPAFKNDPEMTRAMLRLTRGKGHIQCRIMGTNHSLR
jgi:hypothetical protein